MPYNRKITWGKKISEVLLSQEYKDKRAKDAVCEGCGNAYISYISTQRYCKDCQPKIKSIEWERIKNGDLIMYKARTLGANLTLGKGKTDYLYKLLLETIGIKKCVYCNSLITILNVALDHKTPINSNEMRRHKRLFRKELIPFNEKSNLQLICKKCNVLKGNMSHEQFTVLLDFLNKDKVLKDILVKRLGQSNFIYSQRRKH